MDNAPTKMIIILLLIFMFTFGLVGWQGSVYSVPEYENSTNWTNLTTIARTQWVYQNISEMYGEVNTTQEKNPTNVWEVIGGTVSALLTTGMTVGYMFLSIPTWFQALFNDLAYAFSYTPVWFTPIILFFIFIGLISWFIYFWTNKRA